MVKFLTCLLLALVLTSCCLTRPPGPVPRAAPPVVTWAFAMEYAWTDEALAAVRGGMNLWNRECGRELLRESQSAAVTIHHKGLAFEEARVISLVIGGEILGLADPKARVFYLYPAAFEDEWTLQNTAMHEMGHLLGLPHNDGAEYSLMHSGPGPAREYDEISRVDLAELNRRGWQCPGARRESAADK